MRDPEVNGQTRVVISQLNTNLQQQYYKPFMSLNVIKFTPIRISRNMRNSMWGTERILKRKSDHAKSMHTSQPTCRTFPKQYN